MTPKQVEIMAAYFEAAERLADATEDLINASIMRRNSEMLGNFARFARFEEVAKIRLAAYRQARADYEAL